MSEIPWPQIYEQIHQARLVHGVGKIRRVRGLLIESIGPQVHLGEICWIQNKDGQNILAEVVGFQDEFVELMPYGPMQGIAPGTKVTATGRSLKARVGDAILGRIIDPLGNPMDGLGPIHAQDLAEVDRDPPDPISRPRIDQIMPLGVRSIDACITCAEGQRVGVFAGSGVGKSTLMGMIARNTQADINVIALIGERGREVREFIENSLGEEGLKRSVVVVATSSEPAIVRLKGAFVATAIAEYFRARGASVVLMMDSVTRFALAQREIGLAVGEPPTTRGYTPSVFALLPRLFERAGRTAEGAITAFYTVLVEGGDMDEPVADAVRGLLDGHIVMSRELAQQGHFPAVDVLQSVSRLIHEVSGREHLQQQMMLRDLLATYNNSRDLIDIGAYQKGGNPKLDRAIARIDQINSFLRQDVGEKADMTQTLQSLARIVQ